MVGQAETPSLREMLISLLRTPMVTISLRFALLVRSGLMAVQLSPRSVERNTRFAATSSMAGAFGDSLMGVSQLKRYASPAVALVTLAAVGRMLFDSPVTLSRRIMLPPCDSV